MIRALLATAIVMAAVVIIGALYIGDGGGDPAASPRSGTIEWDAPPDIGRPDALPRDRVLAGYVRNGTLEPVELTPDNVDLIDSEGRSITHTTTFAASFARDIYPPRLARKLPEADLLRLGYKAIIDPGQRGPLIVAWRLEDGAPAADRVEIPGGTLDLPAP